MLLLISCWSEKLLRHDSPVDFNDSLRFFYMPRSKSESYSGEFLISFVEQLKMITELCFLYPNLVKIWFLHIMGIIVNSPELIQKVFNSDICMEKPYLAYKLFNLDNGLLSSRYPRWKHDRRFFNNSFKISTLQSFIPVFIETADKLTSEIASYVDGNSFNILDYTIRCTLKMICSTSLGMKISDAENDETFKKVFHAVE